MRKAVSGKVMTILIEVLLAVVAIVLIWYFHQQIFDFMKTLLEGIKNFIRCSLPIVSNRIFGSCP